MSLITLDPTFQPARVPTATEPALAPRPASLEGRTVGFLMNHLSNCEMLFEALAHELGELDGVADFVFVMKDSQSVPPTAEQWDRVSAADVVVTGFGGCGSCSTRSIRDALDLEARGIPAVCVGHTALVPAMRIIAGIGGIPDYPLVTVDYPHSPLAPWDKDEARDTARSIAASVRACLVN